MLSFVLNITQVRFVSLRQPPPADTFGSKCHSPNFHENSLWSEWARSIESLRVLGGFIDGKLGFPI
jgi:hypothetical protein